MYAFRRLIGRHRPLALSAVAFCHGAAKANGNVAAEEPANPQSLVVGQLTHEHLFRQACTVSVNSSCQALVVALAALSDASQAYKNEMAKLMDLFEHNEWTDGAMDDLLMEYRHNVSAAKTVYSNAVIAMDAALKLGQSSGEMSYAIKATTVFNIMSETYYSVDKKVQSCIKDVREVEDKFSKALADSIERNPKN